jgi:uncharacterized protein YbgA (DUF1722 family)/uncharacterized protein YbbK (DUF523 family)
VQEPEEAKSVFEHVVPKVFISHCLGFGRCRYNGQTIVDPFVEMLRPFVEPVTVCPEVEIGLGVPRPPIRLIEEQAEISLIQPETGRDVTNEMTAFAESFLGTLDDVDGFILKYRSPSCGPNQVKVYNSRKPEAGHRKGAGAFGGRIVERFCGFPIEDEGRLHSFDIRQHFLTQLFSLARFRDVVREGTMGSLVAFHSRHKYLLMAYSQSALKRLGRIVANAEHCQAGEVIETYRAGLLPALAKPPRRANSINVLLHVLGHVSDGLKPAEKAFFLDELERYRDQRVCLSAPTSLLRSWIARFEVSYLMDQFYFDPFPETLVEVLDSGKGRKLD